ncbi:MAG TPA: TonB family protein [Terracidiphilus sp.]|jgi:protein TonB
MSLKLLRAGLLLGFFLPLEPILPAQESIFISGDQAVRFEQAPGFFHYAALCRTATEFKAQIPPPRLPREATESAVCWYVKASKTRPAPGAADASADGKLVISEHHIRFIPHDPASAGLYADLHPEQAQLHHDPGQPFASLTAKDAAFDFRFSKLCLDCAPGTPIPTGSNPELLDQEFGLLQDSLKQFHAGWKKIYDLSSKIRVAVQPQNQPRDGDPAAAMRKYAEINRQFAEVCPEPARTCIRSFATYEACKAFPSSANCGAEPACNATCGVGLNALQYLKATACVQLDQQSASLLPDWTDALQQKTAANLPARPLPPGTVEVQLTTGSQPPPGLGCSVQASYLRASTSGTPTPAASSRPIPSIPAPKTTQPASAKSSNPPSPTPKPPLAPPPTVRAAAKPVAPPPAKPPAVTTAQLRPRPVVHPAIPAAPKAAAQTEAKPAAPSTFKPIPPPSNPGRTASANPPAPSHSTAAPTKSDSVALAVPPAPAAKTTKSGAVRLKLAPGTVDNMLVKKVSPVYPLEAKVARVQGTVVLNATINTAGEVAGVDVVSGPALLQTAAVEAVKQWQYRPFSFNGMPIEVETTIHVVFGEVSPPRRPPAPSRP